jgi:hypothetical protein
MFECSEEDSLNPIISLFSFVIFYFLYIIIPHQKNLKLLKINNKTMSSKIFTRSRILLLISVFFVMSMPLVYKKIDSILKDCTKSDYKSFICNMK